MHVNTLAAYLLCCSKIYGKQNWYNVMVMSHKPGKEVKPTLVQINAVFLFSHKQCGIFTKAPFLRVLAQENKKA